MPYQRRRRQAITPGLVYRPNRRPDGCRWCHVEVPAYGGLLYREESGGWSVTHTDAEWAGSPVSGLYVGGCPDSTDQRNREGGFGGPGGPGSEHDRIASRAALAAARAEHEGRRYAYTSSGARMTERHGRCEDAPCCGCCD